LALKNRELLKLLDLILLLRSEAEEVKVLLGQEVRSNAHSALKTWARGQQPDTPLSKWLALESTKVEVSKSTPSLLLNLVRLKLDSAPPSLLDLSEVLRRSKFTFPTLRAWDKLWLTT
jgi:hypothetical protein